MEPVMQLDVCAAEGEADREKADCRSVCTTEGEDEHVSGAESDRHAEAEDLPTPCAEAERRTKEEAAAKEEAQRIAKEVAENAQKDAERAATQFYAAKQEAAQDAERSAREEAERSDAERHAKECDEPAPSEVDSTLSCNSIASMPLDAPRLREIFTRLAEMEEDFQRRLESQGATIPRGFQASLSAASCHERRMVARPRLVSRRG